MLKRSLHAARGFNLIELMITLTVLGLVLMVGLPNMGEWLQNTQIRNAAEGIHAGLQLARAEAIKRNATVRFQLMDSLSSSCALNPTGKNWVVSVGDAADRCDQASSEDPSGPQIIQKRAGTEGSPNATVFAEGGTAPNAAVLFTGLGRAGVGSLTSINVENEKNGVCKTVGGPMRCLRITVSPGGSVRMCDPAVSETTDPEVLRTMMRAAKSQAGVMLIEALIGILIFSIGILALIGMQGAAIRNTTDARYRSEAAFLASQIIGQMWVDRGVSSANLTAYTAAGYAPRDQWVNNVAATLPGIDVANNIRVPTIAHDATTNEVVVTIQWLQPGETQVRNVQLANRINCC